MSSSELYLIREGRILLPANTWFPERAIGHANESTLAYLIPELEGKFREIVAEAEKLQQEFAEESDKIRLAAKLSRQRHYFSHAKAIGDYAPLFSALDRMEEEIRVLVDQVIEQKEAICKEAEALLESKEWKESTEKLRDLQKKLRDLPVVPDLRGEELKARFETAKDEFFRRKQASQEQFDQELLDNLDRKMELCEKAEALQHSTAWKKTTEAFAQLTEEWKQIGMVPRHRIEELWFRFSTAKDIFFARKREHIEEIKVEQDAHLARRNELIQQAEALKESRDWKKTTEAMNALMEEWKKTGRVNSEQGEEAWTRFNAARNFFFARKDEHYAGVRTQLEDNLARKMAIVECAEKLQDSNDFEGATKEFMDMLEEWKTIGRTAKEHGDEAWDRFMKARRRFFERKDAFRDQRRQEISKEIQERVARNRSFFNKVNRELQREEDLLYDVNDRLANLPATLRSYEKREELKEMVTEIEANINRMKAKLKDVREKIQQDEREMNFILRGPKKKEEKKEDKKEDREKQSKKEKPEAGAVTEPVGPAASEAPAYSSEVSDSSAAGSAPEVLPDVDAEASAAVAEEPVMEAPVSGEPAEDIPADSGDAEAAPPTPETSEPSASPSPEPEA